MTKILVVDDEPGVLKSTELLLVDLGFEVLATSDHTEVLPLLRRHRPHVLLQDVRMPGLDVEKLIRDVRADAAVGGTPIVLFSASMELHVLEESVAVNGILEKPFMPEDVLAAIERCLGAAAAQG